MNPTHLIFPPILDGEDKSSSYKNRIRKNYQHVRKWAKRSETDSFRIYDRDIKEYPLAIDLYAGRFCVQLFSFNEPREDLLLETEKVLQALFGVPADAIYTRTRIRRKKIEQYEKRSEQKEFFITHEYGIKFHVNLVDYLDTGLFLDHRETRRLVASLAKGKRVLNLFAYTCSFSVHAALAGAIYTKSVDLSHTYLEWGKEQFLINEIPLNLHEFVRADCLKWLAQEVASGGVYDLIVIDPPTISRSKKMDGLFDVQQDYIYLLEQALHLLSDDGILFFSTNSRHFNFDETLLPSCVIQDISKQTIPLDFHNQKIHQCWKISKKLGML